jgi:hypothetical protein
MNILSALFLFVKHPLLSSTMDVNNFVNESNPWIHLENEYLLTLRQDFDRIDSQLNAFLAQQRYHYDQLRTMIDN